MARGRGKLLEMVRRDDDRERRIGLREPREGGEQELPTGKVEPGPGLVEQQQPGSRHECPRDQGALALAVRAVAEAALGTRPRPNVPSSVSARSTSSSASRSSK